MTYTSYATVRSVCAGRPLRVRLAELLPVLNGPRNLRPDGAVPMAEVDHPLVSQRTAVRMLACYLVDFSGRSVCLAIGGRAKTSS